MSRLSVVVAAFLMPVCGACQASPAIDSLARGQVDARVLVDWNELVLATAEAEDGFLTLKGLRTATVMHLAAHEALNAIDSRYDTYLPVGSAPEADPMAAVVSAAWEVAVRQYPDQEESFGVERDLWLKGVEEGPRRASGLELGEAAAARVLAERRNDGWDSEAEYEWHPMGPGVYAEFAEHSGTPEGFIFGSGWAVARPFMLDTPSHFRSPPPPRITSPDYTVAFREVQEVGSHENGTRTADQAHLAMWWKDFAENSHNRLTRQLVTEESLDLWEAARLFALLNMSIYDAYVNVFDNKFSYNHWRPYTAIRWAAKDGNPETEPDAYWDNLHQHTYAFPSYPSAHGTACAAAATVLENTFGDDYAFTMTTAEVDAAGPFSGKVPMEPPTRSFDSFSSAAMECALSRVYLGIHFRYDSVAGNELGARIGGYAVQEFLEPAVE